MLLNGVAGLISLPIIASKNDVLMSVSTTIVIKKQKAVFMKCNFLKKTAPHSAMLCSNEKSIKIKNDCIVKILSTSTC